MRAPFVITMSQPAAITIPAAESFVAMPPVPRQLPAPPAMRRISSVSAVTRWIKCASGLARGSESYSPSMSLSSTRRSAWQSRATMADSVSLSPSTLC